jgi:hypothetical protein
MLIGMILMLATVPFTLTTLGRFSASALWIRRALWLLATWFFNLCIRALWIAALRLGRPDF